MNFLRPFHFELHEAVTNRENENQGESCLRKGPIQGLGGNIDT